MPEISFMPDAAGRLLWPHIDLRSVMIEPNSEMDRETLRATLVVELLSKSEGEFVTVHVGMLRMALSSGGSPASLQQRKLGTQAGEIAGRLLREQLRRHAKGEAVRIEQTKKAMAEARGPGKRLTTVGGDQYKKSYSAIEKAWQSHKAVSHLWAADTYLFDTHGEEWYRSNIEKKTLDVLALAMDMLTRASAILNDDSSGSMPLLDHKKAWVPPASLQLPPAPFLY